MVSTSVEWDIFPVLPAIKFHNKFSLKRDEVDDVLIDAVLAPRADAKNLLAA